jgi:N6-L-threonylcarbamoyladenine synthase
MSHFYTLAVESSCDETSAAILDHQRVIALVTATQAVHEQYGGVVPELASRAHQSNIVPVVSAVFQKANLTLQDMHLLAVTEGPGLMGALHVGVAFMKSLAMASGKPLVGVNHMKGHVLAHCIQGQYEKEIQFPFACLTVSGGHTQIVLVQNSTDLKVVSTTLDDAAGEALDKGAKLLGLPYPGGPMVDRLAKDGNPKAYSFAVPKKKDNDFSFSGLKTSLLYFIQAQTKSNPHFVQENINDLCASYQNAVVQYLMDQFFRIVKEYNVKDIALAGGVSANSLLRSEFQKRGTEKGYQTFIPQFEYCTDNAAMIGISGYFEYLKNPVARNIVPQPRMAI